MMTEQRCALLLQHAMNHPDMRNIMLEYIMENVGHVNADEERILRDGKFVVAHTDTYDMLTGVEYNVKELNRLVNQLLHKASKQCNQS